MEDPYPPPPASAYGLQRLGGSEWNGACPEGLEWPSAAGGDRGRRFDRTFRRPYTVSLQPAGASVGPILCRQRSGCTELTSDRRVQERPRRTLRPGIIQWADYLCSIRMVGHYSNSHHVEQSFSDDGGKTWQPNFVATLTRDEETSTGDELPLPSVSSAADGTHDFDFNFGVWKTHIHRLQKPLTSSRTWTD